MNAAIEVELGALGVRNMNFGIIHLLQGYSHESKGLIFVPHFELLGFRHGLLKKLFQMFT